MFGSPETTTGGNALKFYSSIRLDIRKVSAIKNSEGDLIGNRTRVKVVKNKLSAPFKQVEFDIIYGSGVDKYGEIVDIATEKGIIKKSGSWFSFEDNKLAQGRDSTVNIIKDNIDLYNKLLEKIKN
jgi:recombination protein RecA